MVVKATALLSAPAMQPIVDPQDPFTPSQASFPHWQDWGENLLDPHALDPRPQSHVNTQDSSSKKPKTHVKKKSAIC